MIRPGGRQRVRMPYVEWLSERLSPRDWAIIDSLQRVRLASSLQLERLHFHELQGRSRSVVRSKVLSQLVQHRALVPLDRRIGFAAHGSTRSRYALDTAGQRLARLRADTDASSPRVRRPRLPGERFVNHALTVTELYVTLVEQARLTARFAVADFEVEAHWPNGLGGWVRPDAFVKLRRGGALDYWAYEADCGTESLPTIESMLASRLDFVQRGQLGPDGIVPRVLIGVPSSRRLAAIRKLVDALPEPADALFVVALLSDVAAIMISELLK